MNPLLAQKTAGCKTEWDEIVKVAVETNVYAGLVWDGGGRERSRPVNFHTVIPPSELAGSFSRCNCVDGVDAAQLNKHARSSKLTNMIDMALNV